MQAENEAGVQFCSTLSSMFFHNLLSPFVNVLISVSFDLDLCPVFLLHICWEVCKMHNPQKDSDPLGAFYAS